MMNMLNIRSPYTASNLNDPDRKTFRDIDDSRFEFLEKMASMFEKMDPTLSKYPGRVMCLTSQTSDALSRTIRGVIAVIKTLLQNGIDYVLTEDINDERLKGSLGYSGVLMEEITICLQTMSRTASNFRESNYSLVLRTIYH